MARLHDNRGVLLGGLNTLQRPISSLLDPYDLVTTSGLNPMYGPEEVVPGLICSFGTLARSTSSSQTNGRDGLQRLPTCHSSTESPEERHHCNFCGGDYCTIHAERAAHDCEYIVIP